MVTIYLKGSKDLLVRCCDTLRECHRIIRLYPVVCWEIDDRYNKTVYIEKFANQGKAHKGVVKAWTKLRKRK